MLLLFRRDKTKESKQSNVCPNFSRAHCGLKPNFAVTRSLLSRIGLWSDRQLFDEFVGPTGPTLSSECPKSYFPNLGLTEELLDVVPGCEGRPGRCSEVSLVRLISENRPVQNHLQGAKGGGTK